MAKQILNDELWQIIEPLIPKKKRRFRCLSDHRKTRVRSSSKRSQPCRPAYPMVSAFRSSCSRIDPNSVLEPQMEDVVYKIRQKCRTVGPCFASLLLFVPRGHS